MRNISNLILGVIVMICPLMTWSMPPSNIMGPSIVTVGQSVTYVYDDGFLYMDYMWSVTNGYVEDEFLWGSEYSVTIRWTTEGSGSIQFTDNFNIVGWKTVTINPSCSAPATPSVSFSISSSSCPPRTLSYSNTPPSGVTWYWQTASSGTSTTNPTNSYNVTSSGTYYVRAYNNSTGCWSTGTASYAVTVSTPPGTPSAPSVSTNSCGAKTLTRGTPPTGVTWYWQGNDPNGTSTASSASTYTANVSGIYYLRARNNSSLCWSLSSRSISVTISPALPTVSVSTNTCGTVTLTANGTPPSGTVWYWQGTNATGTSTANSSATYSATASGTYYIRARITSSSCWSPTSTAVPVTYTAPPSTPPAFTISSNTCGDKTLTKPSAPGGITYFWQGTTFGGTDYTSNEAIASTFLATSKATHYLRARNNTTGCWSNSSYGTLVNVDKPNTPASQNFTFCEFETMTMTTTGYPAGGSLNWYDQQNNLLTSTIHYTVDKFSGNYTYHVKSKSSQNCESANYATITLTVPESCDDKLNWTESTGYTIDSNGDPVPVAASKSYSDGFGNPLQSQSKSFATNQVLAAQPVYDKSGNPSLTTLPAPINSGSFVYKHKFITNANEKRYGVSDFDSGTGSNSGDAFNPNPVGSSVPGTLGWYYSSNNNLEPHTPITNYPFSRSWSPEGPDPTTSTSAGPGDEHKMGSGHEVESERQQTVSGDLDHYYALKPFFDPTPSSFNTDLLSHVSTNTSTLFAPYQNVSIVSVGGKVIVTCNEADDTPGVWPIGGSITVEPNKTYTYSIKGYNVSAQSASLYVTKSSGEVLLWPGATLPIGSTNEDWTSVTFTVPSGVTSIKVGVLWSQPIEDDSFYISDVDFRGSLPTSLGYKFISTDPNDKQAVTFVDADGHTVASATKTGSIYDNWSYTYYNETGQVVATVAPNGVNTASTAYPTFVTLYKYDHLGRLIETTATDEGTTQYVYSNDGKIRFSQNEEQRNAVYKRFSYTNYDYLGRLIESGEYIQAGEDPFVFEPHTTATLAPFSVLNNAVLEAVGHTGVSFKVDNARCREYTFIEYDKQATDFVVDTDHSAQTFTYGQVTKTENANAKTWYSYDEFGQLVWTKQYIAGLGIKTVDYVYDFLGNVTDVIYQKGEDDDFYHHYIYNADQQLSEVWTSLDGTTKTLRAKYHYYLHGPLKRVELAENVQGLDFVYTINGGLKTINSADPAQDPGNDGSNGFAPDVFGQIMHYYNNDYTSAGFNAGSQTFSGYADQFGGALKGVSWHTPVDNNIQTRSYAFTYDNTYQLQEAKFGNSTLGSFVENPLGAFRESIPSYDKNGNIQSLSRTGMTGNVLGNYNYVYESNTNKLDKINHNTSQLVDYSYNAIGQMIQQAEDDKNLYVRYNAYGLVSEVYSNAPYAGGGGGAPPPGPGEPLPEDVPEGFNRAQAYYYDDRGDLVKKTTFDAGVPVANLFYVSDASGNPLAMYEQLFPAGTIQRIEVPIYGSGRVALFKPQVNTYFYEIGDHLGNVRAVIGTPETDVYLATMETENAGSEEPPYRNISTSRVASTAANHTPSGNEAIRINNTRPAGPAISLAVSPGDVLDLETWAYYEAGSNYDNTISASSMISAIAAAFGGVSGAAGEAGEIFNSIDAALGAGGIGLGGTGDPELPGAYLLYMVFDVNKNFTGQGGYTRVTESGNLAKELIGLSSITIEHPGYIYICVYNRSDSPHWVYFDDLKITHERSPVVAGADFFPFGLVMEGREITQEDYRYGYQGQYAEKDTTTGWNQFQLRMYDARFGRWLSVDPYGQFASPYVGMGNAPQMGVDPDGGWSPITAAIGAVVGAGIGYSISGDWKGALIGGLAGGVLGGAAFDQSRKMVKEGRYMFLTKGWDISPSKFGEWLLPGVSAAAREAAYTMFNSVDEAAEYMIDESDKYSRGRVGHEYADGSVAVFKTKGRVYEGRRKTNNFLEDDSYGYHSRPKNDDKLVPHRVKRKIYQDKINKKWMAVHGYIIIGGPDSWNLNVPQVSNGNLYHIKNDRINQYPVKDGRQGWPTIYKWLK